MIFNVLTNDTAKSPLIPIANGVYYTRSMVLHDKSLEFNSGDFAIVFYAADGTTPVTPTGGTIVPVMSPIDGIWLGPGLGDSTIDATKVIASTDGTATYSTPTFSAGAKQGRITFAGILGATYAIAEFRRNR